MDAQKMRYLVRSTQWRIGNDHRGSEGSESKAKTTAGQLPNRMPMQKTRSGQRKLRTEARCNISSPKHEIALVEIQAAFRSTANDLSPKSAVRSGESHLD